MKKNLIVIVFIFCISFLLMIALSIISMNRLSTYSYFSNFTDTSGLSIENIYQVELHLRDVDRSERGYMLTKDTMYRHYVNNAIDSLNSDLIDIYFLTDDNPIQQKNIDIFKDTMQMRISAARNNINYVDTTKSSTLSKYFYDSRELMRACSRRIKVIHKEENRLRDDRINNEHKYEMLTSSTLVYILIIFCLVTLVLFAVLIKELINRIRYQTELQTKIVDLKRSHIELEEIAYAASHDLQEPLRKIQVFTNMMLYQKTDITSEEGKDSLLRINNAANKMQLLIANLLNLTSLTRIDENKTPIDLNRVIKFLLIDLDEKISEKNALVLVDKLPVINGYENQIKLLFSCLFDNSLKFINGSIQPIIKISNKVVDGISLVDLNPNLKNMKFIVVSFADNGIGFDNTFVNKIFILFQQLQRQNTEYTGKGIGLPICQRIISNHGGYIVADGKVGEGAVINLYFPVE